MATTVPTAAWLTSFQIHSVNILFSNIVSVLMGKIKKVTKLYFTASFLFNSVTSSPSFATRFFFRSVMKPAEPLSLVLFSCDSTLACCLWCHWVLIYNTIISAIAVTHSGWLTEPTADARKRVVTNLITDTAGTLCRDERRHSALLSLAETRPTQDSHNVIFSATATLSVAVMWPPSSSVCW